MTDRPIIFNGPMVRAILDGRKTQTRRVMPRDKFFVNGRPFYANGKRAGLALNAIPNPRNQCIEIGDRLWIRESWTTRQGLDDTKPSEISQRQSIGYMADDEGPCLGKIRPPIFMCRWMSRLTLTVTDVRVQRVQEIGNDDAVAEGVEFLREHDRNASDAFSYLWDSINGTRSGCAWSENPWVAAYSFTVEERNIDHG